MLTILKQMVQRDFSAITPNVMAKNVTNLNFRRMRELGFEHIIFDKDNTLTTPGGYTFHTKEL